MKTIYKTLKPKKLVGKQIKICIRCGNDKISTSDFTIVCNVCDALNFYEK